MRPYSLASRHVRGVRRPRPARCYTEGQPNSSAAPSSRSNPRAAEATSSSHPTRTPEEQASISGMMRNWRMAVIGSITLGIGYELGTRNAQRKPRSSSSPASEPQTSQAQGSSSPSTSSMLSLTSYPPPQHNLSDKNLREARAEFVALLGEDGIDTQPGNRKNHSSTEWSPSPTSQIPDLIVLPRSTEDVSAIMKICHRRCILVTPFSGGTSLDGALAATRRGISLDFSRMDNIVAIHERDLDVVVQPGVCWADLNQTLEPLGLFFPLDPAPTAQIGGMVATGCSGTNAYRYGSMKNWTLGLTVVLADGSIIKTRNRPRKSTAGYDLTRLMIGSSGTLGIVTEATLKLTAKPTNVHAAVIPFPSIHAAVSSVIDIVQRGLALEAIELLDEVYMRCINQSGFTQRVWPEKPTLFLKFAGSPQTVAEQISTVKALTGQHGALSFEADGDPQAVESLWAARKQSLLSFLAMKKSPDDGFISSDVAVPISRMADVVEKINGRAAEEGMLGGTIGHVGDGNFHFSVLYEREKEQRARAVWSESHRLAVEMEGTVTGEHGIGLELRDALRLELGDGAVDTMRRIKDALDPQCLLNCDKVVRMEVGDDH